MSKKALKERLDKEVALRNVYDEVCEDNPDPILIARQYQDEYSALICALFSYGKVASIIGFLNSVDFSLIEQGEDSIRKSLHKHYYRFQNSEDIIQFFLTLKALKVKGSLNQMFLEAYQNNHCVLEGINHLIEAMHGCNDYTSRGYRFLIGSPTHKRKGSGALKRWHMYLRWMVRKDAIDLGLWEGVDTKDLIIPLDTHTFHVAKQLKLLKRKTYDLEAAYELTAQLKKFDPSDPVKYDFALYRLGQEIYVK